MWTILIDFMPILGVVFHVIAHPSEITIVGM